MSTLYVRIYVGSDYAIMVNSGDMISKENKRRMNQMGKYIEVAYPRYGWEGNFEAQFQSALGN